MWNEQYNITKNINKRFLKNHFIRELWEIEINVNIVWVEFEVKSIRNIWNFREYIIDLVNKCRASYTSSIELTRFSHKRRFFTKLEQDKFVKMVGKLQN